MKNKITSPKIPFPSFKFESKNSPCIQSYSMILMSYKQPGFWLFAFSISFFFSLSY